MAQDHARTRTPESDAVAERFQELAAELRDLFLAWPEQNAWSDDRLDRLARRAHAIQLAGNPPYRRYCSRLGIAYKDLSGWRDAPAVPTAAFREVDLHVRAAGQPSATFRTSGTTQGAAHRGSHLVADLGLYEAAMSGPFRRWVLPTGPPPVIFSLVEPFEPQCESSLGWMCDAAIRLFGVSGSRAVVGASGIDWDLLAAVADEAATSKHPILILTTTLALDEWTRRLASAGQRHDLPIGSRIMDTGGGKGRLGVERSAALDRAETLLGISPDRVINEFGMTELLSQRYAATADGRLRGPPWLRTRALDPVSLDVLGDGETGVLCHFDLANLGSVCAVLTEDLGRVHDGAVEWIGRSPGAPPRGCSLATAELLAAQRDG